LVDQFSDAIAAPVLSGLLIAIRGYNFQEGQGLERGRRRHFLLAIEQPMVLSSVQLMSGVSAVNCRGRF
jgi:hypothetical protein